MLSGARRWASTLARRRVIVSGIQPTGVPHLGNYLGALKTWTTLQNEADPQDELYFFIASLHALTIPQNPKQLYHDRRNLLAALIAVGLDPHRCTIFMQDQVPQHAELSWLLMCQSPFGRLERMTTWKSKIATIQNSASEDHVNESQLQLGLFAYPVLQTADILMYHATHVPVGEDQQQHLELTRDLAHSFNRSVKKPFFPIPEALLSESKRILSLRNPEQKMSKSAPDANSRIMLTDTPQQIQSKVKKAVTDSEGTLSFDPASRPAISNLLQILAGMDGGVLQSHMTQETTHERKDPAFLARFLNEYAGGSSAALKRTLADSIIEELRPVQKEYSRLISEDGFLDEIERLGCEKACLRAQETMSQVRTMLGLHQ